MADRPEKKIQRVKDAVRALHERQTPGQPPISNMERRQLQKEIDDAIVQNGGKVSRRKPSS